jgi:hypothetical protein
MTQALVPGWFARPVTLPASLFHLWNIVLDMIPDMEWNGGDFYAKL